MINSILAAAIMVSALLFRAVEIWSSTVVLKLQDARGEKFYAALTALEGETAVVHIGPVPALSDGDGVR
jgi:hypothetical protein